MTVRQRSSIAVCGIAGSFSDAASKELVKRHTLRVATKYEISAAAVFSSVASGKSQCGVIPLFNLLGGPVLETVAAMSRYTFRVVDALSLRIEQNLFVVPGKTNEDIRAVVSHAQALSQCRNYLAKHFPSAYLQEYADTALAAKDLAEGHLPRTTAIVASLEAGELFGLELLEATINDDPENYTTFLLIADVEALRHYAEH